MRLGWTIFRYLISSTLPYFISSWLLLSVVLFIQQAGRFTDIFFSANIPTLLVWQLSLALLPNVIAFTCPMAALVGVIIGLTKMQSDSELVAIRAAGVGSLAISLPFVFLGILLSLFGLLVNVKGVPVAAGIVRDVALRTALYKLESPIEPGVFNTELAGFTIYVREGDLQSGTWKKIFIHHQDPKDGTLRLITSGGGRIDYSGENTELVLEDAVSTTLGGIGNAGKVYSERIGTVRYQIRTKRTEVVEKLNKAELSPEELGLSQLSELARSKEGSERIEAHLLWQRRLLLSVSPLIFCIFGAAFVLRYNRFGRGFATVSALVSLIVYYLLGFLGEQMARTGGINVSLAIAFPIGFSLIAIAWFALGGKFHTPQVVGSVTGLLSRAPSLASLSVPKIHIFRDLRSGLRDFDIFAGLVRYYLLAIAFLGAIFLIFTAFELWRFAGAMPGGIGYLLSYLGYLSPFVYLQLAPSALMIATLATYVIKSRQNEIVTWTAAGQSIYRLLLPCLLFMLFMGFLNWQIQERIYPHANVKQDEIRNFIRARGKINAAPAKTWIAIGNRIYSFDPINASDNEIGRDRAKASPSSVQNLTVYLFDADNAVLQSVYRTSRAVWREGYVIWEDEVESIVLDGKSVTRRVDGAGVVSSLPEKTNPFNRYKNRASQMNAAEVSDRLDDDLSESDRRTLSLALQKKYTTALVPLVLALFTAPFALSLSRKGKAATVGYAVGLWLVFMGIASVFEQLGNSGTLTPAVAVWAPLALFTMLGVYMLSRVRT